MIGPAYAATQCRHDESAALSFDFGKMKGTANVVLHDVHCRLKSLRAIRTVPALTCRRSAAGSAMRGSTASRGR